MSDLTAVLVGGGDVDLGELSRCLAEAGIRIGADGGALALARCGARPDWVVGDFDSLTEADLAGLRAAGAGIRRYPHEKDWTDLEIGLELARELGASSALIFGATGDRLDHTLTNLGMLRRAADLGLAAMIHAPGQRVRLLRPGRTSFTGVPGQVLSLVPLTGEVAAVTTEGLRYPLRAETLYLGRSRGVHNEFLGREAAVSLTGGELLAFLFAPRAINICQR